MLSAIPDLSAQEKTNSGALCKRDRNNNKTTVVVVVAISNYSIYIALCAYIIAKFFQGGYRTKMKIRSDENENQVGKFFARLRRAKKGVPKFFACGGLFSSWRN